MSVRAGLGRDLRTTVVAVVAASVVAGSSAATAAAVYVANADKVDNKHAVGAGATVSERSGKLVATSSRTGRLPNDILAKAPNSGALDGLDSTDFLRANGTAADADKIDGKDVSELLPVQASAEYGDPASTTEPVFPLTGQQPEKVVEKSRSRSLVRGVYRSMVRLCLSETFLEPQKRVRNFRSAHRRPPTIPQAPGSPSGQFQR